MSKSWGGGSTRAWRTLRAAILYRDERTSRRTGEPFCRLRVPGVCVGESVPMHVHHIHGKASGCAGCAADHPAHLESTCAPCNLHVGEPTKQQAGDPPCRPMTRWT